MASEWTTVSYKKQKTVKQVPVKQTPAQTFQVQTFDSTPKSKVDITKKPNRAHAPVNASHVEKRAEEGDLKLPTVSQGLRSQIQQARNQKGMTQKQLAVACNLQESVIRAYEQGTCIPNSKEMNVMGNVLGVTLKNKT